MEAIHVAPAHRTAMEPVSQVEARAGEGLVGDRFLGTRHRHVSVQAEEDLAETARVLGRPAPPDLTRRNITISGAVVPTTPGDRLTIGGVELEVVRRAAPCRIMDETLGPGGRAALHDRGGVVCRLLGSGTISIGDGVEIGERAELNPPA